MEPKVSIIMGVYNEEKHISRSIKSIIDQSYTNWEFIICDDCSKDNTYIILKEFEKKDDRIKVIKNKTNVGLAASLNNCLKYCSGKYIARQDGDDVSYKNRLKKQVEFLENRKEYDLIGGNADIIDNDEKIWGTLSYPESPCINDLVKGNCFAHNTILIKRSIIEKLNGYNEKALRVEDYDLWFRLYSSGYKAFNIQECFVKYNVDISDYKKRKYKYRINEFKVRINGCAINKVPYLKRIYCVKPLIVGIIPGAVMSKIHKRKFNN